MTEQPAPRNTRWDEHNAERRQLIVESVVAAIQNSPDGAEINVGQVAEQAGLVRTVIYRHFRSRDDLLRAAQVQIVTDLRSSLEDGLSIEGSIGGIANRSVAAFVGWVEEHPKLYRAAQLDLADGRSSPFAEMFQQVSDRIATLIQFVMEMGGVKLRSLDRATVEVVASGLVGQVRGTVDHWIRLPGRRPSAELLIEIMGRSIWFQLAGHAADLGVEITPDTPIRELFA